MNIDYVLVLTSGKHIVDTATAARIVGAIEAEETIVDVEIDMHGDGVSLRNVKLITRHVVMLIESVSPNQLSLDDAVCNNVRSLINHRSR